MSLLPVVHFEDFEDYVMSHLNNIGRVSDIQRLVSLQYGLLSNGQGWVVVDMPIKFRGRYVYLRVGLAQ